MRVSKPQGGASQEGYRGRWKSPQRDQYHTWDRSQKESQFRSFGESHLWRLISCLVPSESRKICLVLRLVRSSARREPVGCGQVIADLIPGANGAAFWRWR